MSITHRIFTALCVAVAVAIVNVAASSPDDASASVDGRNEVGQRHLQARRKRKLLQHVTFDDFEAGAPTSWEPYDDVGTITVEISSSSVPPDVGSIYSLYARFSGTPTGLVGGLRHTLTPALDIAVAKSFSFFIRPVRSISTDSPIFNMSIVLVEADSDEFVYYCTVGAGSSCAGLDVWTEVVIPLSSFSDRNAGLGNGFLTGPIQSIDFAINSSVATYAYFYLDNIFFNETDSEQAPSPTITTPLPVFAPTIPMLAPNPAPALTNSSSAPVPASEATNSTLPPTPLPTLTNPAPTPAPASGIVAPAFAPSPSGVFSTSSPTPEDDNNIFPFPSPTNDFDSSTPFPTPGDDGVFTPFPTPGDDGVFTPFPTPGESDVFTPFPTPGESDVFTLFPTPDVTSAPVALPPTFSLVPPPTSIDDGRIDCPKAVGECTDNDFNCCYPDPANSIMPMTRIARGERLDAGRWLCRDEFMFGILHLGTVHVLRVDEDGRCTILWTLEDGAVEGDYIEMDDEGNAGLYEIGGSVTPVWQVGCSMGQESRIKMVVVREENPEAKIVLLRSFYDGRTGSDWDIERDWYVTRQGVEGVRDC